MKRWHNWITCYFFLLCMHATRWGIKVYKFVVEGMEINIHITTTKTTSFGGDSENHDQTYFIPRWGDKRNLPVCTQIKMLIIIILKYFHTIRKPFCWTAFIQKWQRRMTTTTKKENFSKSFRCKSFPMILYKQTRFNMKQYVRVAELCLRRTTN